MIEVDVSADVDPQEALERLTLRSGGAPMPGVIGRYDVVEQIGEGGMGVVYLARDRSLDRLLAIKLIGGDETRAEDRARLQREARAMARLSHPNVVTVHEVGEHEGRLFIAMEYVKGASLTSWLTAASRSWAEIVQVFIAAGEGLAAAHTAGVIHRDFKPDNVLVGDDGRVRVADFGLAWTGAELPENAPTERQWIDALTARAVDEAPLTETGAVLGTLAYMAPEQYRGQAPSVAADLFSFSVSLYRALYGRLPFDTDSPALYRVRALAGEVGSAPRGASVPGWLRAIVLHGLEARPEARWGSTEELLAALRRGAPRGRWVALALASVGALGIGLALALPLGDLTAGEGACAAPEAALAGVWDGAIRERLGRRLRATAAPVDPPRVWRSVDRLLDLYADRWLLEHTRACLSAGEVEAAKLRERQVECLDHNREQLAAVVQLLDGGAIDAESAVLAVTGLPAPELCREAPGALTEAADPHRRRLGLAAVKVIARASADVDVGRLVAARTAVAEVLEVAEELASPALFAEAELTLGRVERAEKRSDTARATLERARARIRGAPEHRALELRALIQLVDVVGVGQGSLDEAEALAAEARALADEIGAPPLLEAYLANNLARVYRAHRRFEAASGGYLDAYALLRQVLGDSAPETIAVRANLGVVQSLLGEPEAVAILEHALEQQLSVLGEHHPRTPAILRNLGNALGRRGAYVRAEAALRRAASIRAENGGERSLELAGDLVSLARALRGQERLGDAELELRRAAEIFEAAGEAPSASLRRERRAVDAALAE